MDGSTGIKKDPVAGLKVVERFICGTGPLFGGKKRSDFPANGDDSSVLKLEEN